MIDHDAVLQLAKARVYPGGIAERLGLRSTQVYHSLARWRRKGEDIPKFSLKSVKQPRRRVPVRPHVRDALEIYAQERGCDVIDLAELILDRVVVDDLVDAVLDDGGADGR